MTIIIVPKTPEPSLAVALTVTAPLLTAAKSPAELIVAIPVPFVIDHVTALFVELAGITDAIN